ncbi:tumor necrosis factor receptor superfamily member 14-like [Engraulis encrasicolus]|uniref:tumor necrosis factor receptor superfamily member 14-like n=1 Tax=Engraulis encrasicolus TaxID=184585 RepID=UPI002FD595EF
MISQFILKLPLQLLWPILLILHNMLLLMLIMMAISMLCAASHSPTCSPAEYEVLFLLAMPLCYVASQTHTCSPSEYEVMGECCPMCNPGYHVYRHCTEYTSTTCAPCPRTTYTEAHNGLNSCKKCTVCDSSAGLRVKRNCSSTSDTLCEPLEGHYCTDPIKYGCQGAVKHTECKPGQYIKQKGSASSDTVCSDCDSYTYSDGSSPSFRPHTQ